MGFVFAEASDRTSTLLSLGTPRPPVTSVQSLILVRLAASMVMWGRLHAGRQASLYQQADVSPVEAYTVCSPWGPWVIALCLCWAQGSVSSAYAAIKAQGSGFPILATLPLICLPKSHRHCCSDVPF